MAVESTAIRVKYAIAMVLFFLGEIGPIPLMPIIGLIVVIFRPRWFVIHVHRIYSTRTFRKARAAHKAPAQKRRP